MNNKIYIYLIIFVIIVIIISLIFLSGVLIHYANNYSKKMETSKNKEDYISEQMTENYELKKEEGYIAETSNSNLMLKLGGTLYNVDGDKMEHIKTTKIKDDIVGIRIIDEAISTKFSEINIGEEIEYIVDELKYEFVIIENKIVLNEKEKLKSNDEFRIVLISEVSDLPRYSRIIVCKKK